jgi:hypothetical protein
MAASSSGASGTGAASSRWTAPSRTRPCACTTGAWNTCHERLYTHKPSEQAICVCMPSCLGGLLSAGACLLCGFRVIEPESGRTVLDTRGQDGAAPAVEFQTGKQAAFYVHAQLSIGTVCLHVSTSAYQSCQLAATQRGCCLRISKSEGGKGVIAGYAGCSLHSMHRNGHLAASHPSASPSAGCTP